MADVTAQMKQAGVSANGGHGVTNRPTGVNTIPDDSPSRYLALASLSLATSSLILCSAVMVFSFSIHGFFWLACTMLAAHCQNPERLSG